MSRAPRPPSASQVRVLRCLRDLTARRGYPPTFRELAYALGYFSTNSISCHLRALERHGLVRREPSRARALSITTAGARLLGGAK